MGNLKNVAGIIGKVIKYLPVILVAFEALKMVKSAIEKVDGDASEA